MLGYFGVYGSLGEKCFCLVTDPSKVLLWTGKGFVVPHWGGLCRGRSFNDNMVKNPFNESMHPLLS